MIYFKTLIEKQEDILQQTNELKVFDLGQENAECDRA